MCVVYNSSACVRVYACISVVCVPVCTCMVCPISHPNSQIIDCDLKKLVLHYSCHFISHYRVNEKISSVLIIPNLFCEHGLLLCRICVFHCTDGLQHITHTAICTMSLLMVWLDRSLVQFRQCISGKHCQDASSIPVYRGLVLLPLLFLIWPCAHGHGEDGVLFGGFGV